MREFRKIATDQRSWTSKKNGNRYDESFVTKRLSLKALRKTEIKSVLANVCWLIARF